MSMHHHHAHNHSCAHHAPTGSRALKLALLITLIFVLVQFIGGLVANSMALMADAAHMAADAGSFVLSLFALWIARRPSSTKMSYGYYRAEILGAFFSGLILWVICGFLIYEAF